MHPPFLRKNTSLWILRDYVGRRVAYMHKKNIHGGNKCKGWELWSKFERPLIFTNSIARNVDSASRLFTLEVKVQRPSLSKLFAWHNFWSKVTNSG
jgi:hypothetical protein